MLDKSNFKSVEKNRIINLFKEYYASERLEIWESFNAFYNCKYRNATPYVNKREHEKIEGISDEYQQTFKDWVDKDLPEGILSFYEFMQVRPHPQFPCFKAGGVIDMGALNRNTMNWNTPTNGHVVQYYSDKGSLREFLFSIYQIRCNKAHWEKDPDSESDIEILRRGSMAIRAFLEFLYAI